MAGSKKSVDSQAIPLTLRTLYQMLTKKDYLSYLPAVFDAKELRGKTMVPFWRDLLCRALPDDFDLSIFDTQEKRSRLLSSLLNRSGNNRMMKPWFDAFSDELSEALFVRLAAAWVETLSAGSCNLRALRMRLRFYTDRIFAGDEAIIPRIRAFLESAGGFLYEDEAQTDNTASPLYQCASYLSWLTLHALYGARMSESPLEGMRIKLGSGDRIRQIVVRGSRPTVLTERDCAFCAQPMPEERFVGRLETLERAKRILYVRGRLLVSGMGGIGKTELVRQLLSRLQQEGLYRSVAFVQYRDSLTESLRKAFGDDYAASMEIYRTRLRGERTLLLIDDMNRSPHDDPALGQLTTLGCDVIVTSRLSGLTGFETLKLEPLKPKEAWRVFEDSCGFPQQRRECDDRRLYACLMGHPLALIMMGRVCRTRYWNADTLYKQLETDGFSGLSYVMDATRQSVEAELKERFDISKLPKTAGMLLRLLAVLPQRFWKPRVLAPMAADLFADEAALCDHLQALADWNWLTQREQGYMLHPVIAGRLNLEPCDSNLFPRLWRWWRAVLEGGNGAPALESAWETIMREALRHMRGLNDDAAYVAMRLQVVL